MAAKMDDTRSSKTQLDSSVFSGSEILVEDESNA